jgi:DNA-binding transcriptional ArsR family regulator
LSIPIDITDPRVVKAYAHPLRIQILRLLDDRIASPSWIAAELKVPLSNASYHVRRLNELGLIELVERVARRGALEHRYTARYHPTVSDEEWRDLPQVVKDSYIHKVVRFGWAHVTAAAEQGGFNRPDIHYSRTFGRLDGLGWQEVAEVLKATLTRIEDIVADAEKRAEAGELTEADEATVIMMHFAGPSGGAENPVSMDELRATSSSVIRASRRDSA